MKKLLATAVVLLSFSGAVFAQTNTSSDEFLSEHRMVQEVNKSVAVRLGDGAPSQLFTYQGIGEAYKYEDELCAYGGYPTQDDMGSLLTDPSVQLVTEDGPLAILHCENPKKDIIVRVKRESYRELLLAYAAPDGSAIKKGDNMFSVRMSSWPTPSSFWHAGIVLEAAYVVVANETAGIRLIDNGAEVILQMSRDNLLNLTGWGQEDLKCNSQDSQTVSLMIPLKWPDYFPGDTGNIYVSALFRALLDNTVVLNVHRYRVGPGFCQEGLYEVIVPLLPGSN